MTGKGHYVDDIASSGCAAGLCVEIKYYPGRHYHFGHFDARDADRVHFVLTLADREAAGLNVVMNANIITNTNSTNAAALERQILARGRVRFAVEPVEFIVADTLAHVREVAKMNELDFKYLNAHMDLVAGGPALHTKFPDNVAFDCSMGNVSAMNL